VVTFDEQHWSFSMSVSNGRTPHYRGGFSFFSVDLSAGNWSASIAASREGLAARGVVDRRSRRGDEADAAESLAASQLDRRSVSSEVQLVAVVWAIRQDGVDHQISGLLVSKPLMKRLGHPVEHVGHRPSPARTEIDGVADALALLNQGVWEMGDRGISQVL
jgi:hypothetical protein